MPFRRLLSGVLLALSVLAPGEARAQQDPPLEGSPGLEGGAGYFMVGGAWPMLGDLADRLEAAGFSEPGRSFLLTGGGGHGLIGRVLVGGEGYGLSLQNRVSRRGDYRAAISGGYGLFRLGYAFVQSRALSVYGLAGLGGAGLSVRLYPEGDVSFDDVLTQPQRQASLSTGGVLLDASLGLDYRLRVASEEDGGWNFVLLGLRAGYSFVPFPGDWETLGGDVTGAPSVGLSGPSIRLLIGFGGVGPRKR